MKQTQRNRLLQELKKGKVNSYYATYNMHIKQAPARIKELREDGYKIITVTLPDRSVDWVLDQLPERDRPYRLEFDNENNLVKKVYLV